MEDIISSGAQSLTEIDGVLAGKTYEVLNIYTKKGNHLFNKKRLLSIAEQGNTLGQHIIIKSHSGGIVKDIYCKPGDVIKLGSPVILIEACTHPTVLGDICCDCGSMLDTKEGEDVDCGAPALVSMLHSIPDLKVSQQEAKRLGTEDMNNLLSNRKLALLFDLDQTLIHTTNDNVPPNLEDVYHFQLRGKGHWYHARLRPGTRNFLNSIAKLYELHICTFGVREYAHHIAHFLDPDKRLFNERILSRNECLDPKSKKGNLSSLFPCGDNMVCIIDDRPDVWNFSPNVVQVTPYLFFNNVGDINAPPGSERPEDQRTPSNTPKPEVEEEEKKSDTTASKESSEEEQSVTKEDESTKDPEKVENDKEDSKSSDTSKDSDKEEKSSEESDKEPSKKEELDVIVPEDKDNLLHYLEIFLKDLHENFYSRYESSNKKNLPDLKRIIPATKQSILQGVHIVFSGVVPTNARLKTSTAFRVAVSLGATVSEAIQSHSQKNPTTHVVATSEFTQKAKQARKAGLHLVSPDWLWQCAERWSRANEKEFRLRNKNIHPVKIVPPLHMDVPVHAQEPPSEGPPSVKRSPSMIEELNPLVFMSNDETKSMQQEVDDDLSDETDDENDDATPQNPMGTQSGNTSDALSSNEGSSDDNDDDDRPASKRRKLNVDDDEETRDGEDSDDELPSVRFRQGGHLPSDHSDNDSEDTNMDVFGDLLEKMI